MRTLVFVLIVCAVTSAHADPPLRYRTPLIARLGDATFDPPLTLRDLDEPCQAQSYANPYSPLPKPLNNRHHRVTAAAKGAVVELRDSFLLDLPRAVTFELTGDLVAPADARLEFGYRVQRCKKGKGKAELTAVVLIEDATGTTMRRLRLDTRRPPREAPWREARLDLPLAPGQPVRLTIAFETEAQPGELMLVWAEPAISGRDPNPSDPARDTNVLWVVIDAVRSDALGPARTFALPTPSLDRPFAEGTAFMQAHSMGNQTRTSTTAMIASAHPAIGGFHSHDWAFARGKLDGFYAARPPLVTAVLEAAGWRVAHFGHNFFLWGDDPVGIDAGFPRIVDFRAIPRDAIDASDRAVAFFEAHQDERWLLMLNYTAPHTPYQAPEAWDEAARELPGPERFGAHQHLPRSYLGELMWVDHNFQRVLAALDALDLTKKTLVIITADHGEVMLPWHDCRGEGGERCGFNHSWTLYDDETHVPLTFALPGRVEAGHVVDTPVSHLDLAPTILDLLGQPPAPGMGGVSLRAALEGRPVTASPVYADGRRAAAIRIDHWKLILHSPDDLIESPARRTERDKTPKHELFDLAADPTEKKNLADDEPEVVERLAGQLREVRGLLAARFASRARVPTTEEVAGAAPIGDVVIDESRADNRLLNAGTDALSGAIRVVGGAASCGPAAAGVTCSVAGDTLVVRLEANARLAFESRPWGAPLEVALRRGGALVPVDRLRLGNWGLALLAPGQTFDGPARLELAVAEPMVAPIVQPRDPAVYYWRSAYVPGADGRRVTRPAEAPIGTFVAPEDQVADPDADAQLGSEVRKVLKDLGYTH